MLVLPLLYIWSWFGETFECIWQHTGTVKYRMRVSAWFMTFKRAKRKKIPSGNAMKVRAWECEGGGDTSGKLICNILRSWVTHTTRASFPACSPLPLVAAFSFHVDSKYKPAPHILSHSCASSLSKRSTLPSGQSYQIMVWNRWDKNLCLCIVYFWADAKHAVWRFHLCTQKTFAIINIKVYSCNQDPAPAYDWDMRTFILKTSAWKTSYVKLIGCIYNQRYLCLLFTDTLTVNSIKVTWIQEVQNPSMVFLFQQYISNCSSSVMHILCRHFCSLLVWRCVLVHLQCVWVCVWRTGMESPAEAAGISWKFFWFLNWRAHREPLSFWLQMHNYSNNIFFKIFLIIIIRHKYMFCRLQKPCRRGTFCFACISLTD